MERKKTRNFVAYTTTFRIFFFWVGRKFGLGLVVFHGVSNKYTKKFIRNKPGLVTFGPLRLSMKRAGAGGEGCSNKCPR